MEALFECLLYLAAGWLFWRSPARLKGVGWKLLAGALLLRVDVALPLAVAAALALVTREAYRDASR